MVLEKMYSKRCYCCYLVHRLEKRILRKGISKHRSSLETTSIQLKSMYDRWISTASFEDVQLTVNEIQDDMELQRQIKFNRVNNELNNLFYLKTNTQSLIIFFHNSSSAITKIVLNRADCVDQVQSFLSYYRNP